MNNQSLLIDRLKLCFKRANIPIPSNLVSEDLFLQFDMDQSEAWTSLSYFSLVGELEQEFNLSFTDEELLQLFKVSHIIHILDAKRSNAPLSDESHFLNACKNSFASVRDNKETILILSASTTRESLLPPKPLQDLLDSMVESSRHINIFNASLSGLTHIEICTMIEMCFSYLSGTTIVLGLNEILLGCCGVDEVKRSLDNERFKIDDTQIGSYISSLNQYKSYIPKPVTPVFTHDEFQSTYTTEGYYDPYIYPTLDKWNTDKLYSWKSIYTFYNGSFMNYDQSFDLFKKVLDILSGYKEKFKINIVFHELPLHPGAQEVVSSLPGFIDMYSSTLDYIMSSGYRIIKLLPEERHYLLNSFRDPGHLCENKTYFSRLFLGNMLKLSL